MWLICILILFWTVHKWVFAREASSEKLCKNSVFYMETYLLFSLTGV